MTEDTNRHAALHALSAVIVEAISRVKHALTVPVGEFAGQIPLIIFELETASASIVRLCRSIKRHGLPDVEPDRRGPPPDRGLLATALTLGALMHASEAGTLSVCPACGGFRVAPRNSENLPGGAGK